MRLRSIGILWLAVISIGASIDVKQGGLKNSAHDEQISPYWIARPRTQYVLEGHPVQFDCTIGDISGRTVEWVDPRGRVITFNDVSLYANLYTLNGKYNLFIADVRESLVGIYTCKAGTFDKASAYLGIINVTVTPQQCKTATAKPFCTDGYRTEYVDGCPRYFCVHTTTSKGCHDKQCSNFCPNGYLLDFEGCKIGCLCRSWFTTAMQMASCPPTTCPICPSGFNEYEHVGFCRRCYCREFMNTTAAIVVTTPATDPRDCYELQKRGVSKSGVYKVYPHQEVHGVVVYCDMETDGGGWLVFQNRIDGVVDFNRNWYSYKSGFGDMSNEFWLGNALLHTIVQQTNYSLRIDMEYTKNESRYAVYDHFHIKDESSRFQLSVSEYHGDAGDSLFYHNSMQFSTRDSDNDFSKENVAVKYNGGWWFNTGFVCYLNGPYGTWYGMSWPGMIIPMKQAQMKIRPRSRN